MEETKPKKRASRAKAANSPSPSSFMAPCGHSHCGERCNVRYVGPTSHLSHHHIMHAARGVTHIWSAVIIAGLAVVITGGVVFATANAQAQQQDDYRSAQATSMILNKLEGLEARMNALEKDFSSLREAGQPTQELPVSP